MEDRNKHLCALLKESGIKDKHVSELEMAIESNLVKEFWVACQG